MHNQSKHVLYALIVIIVVLFMYAVTHLGAYPQEEETNIFFAKLNNETDFRTMFDVISDIKTTVDKQMIISMCKENRENLMDVFRMHIHGFGGAGYLFADVHKSIVDLYDRLESNRSLLAKLTEEQVTTLLNGLVMYNPEYFNETVIKGGVIELRSVDYLSNLTESVNSCATNMHVTTMLIKRWAPELRQRFMAREDMHYAREVSERVGVTGWAHNTLGALPTKNLMVMFEILAKFMRVTRYIYQQEAMQNGYSPIVSKMYWIFRIFTGFGLPVLPLVFFIFLTLKFMFYGTFLHTAYIMTFYRRYVSLFKIAIRNDLESIVVFMRNFAIFFTLTNILSVIASHAITVLCSEKHIGTFLFKFAVSRVNIVRIMYEETTSNHVMSIIVMSGILIADCYLPRLMVQMWRCIDSWLFTLPNPNTRDRQITDSRMYDATLRRMHMLSLFKMIMNSTDIWSVILKLTLYSAAKNCTGFSLMPVFAEVDEAKHLVSWTAAAWTPEITK